MKQEFKPTFLYIKRHSITGLLYFGKTISSDVQKYKGSGVRWHAHIKKHGDHLIDTIWFCLFTVEDELVKFAKMFSVQENIVKSDCWANLIIETGNNLPIPNISRKGLPGNRLGTKVTPEARARMRIAQNNPETVERKRIALKAAQNRPEVKLKKSIARRGHKNSEETLIKIRATMATPEYREKYSKLMRGKHHKPWSAELTENMRRSRLNFCTLDGIVIYCNKHEVSKYLGQGSTGSRSPSLKFLDLAVEWVPVGPFCLLSEH